MKEIWKPIEGFENYRVSNLGNIKRTKCSILVDNRFLRNYNEKPLKGFKNNKGYIQVSFSRNGRNIKKFVHRFVCQSFLENPENKKQINHINGIRDDNRLVNLEWSTQSENILHSYKFLNRKRPKTDNRGKIVLDLNTGVFYNSAKEVAELYGLNTDVLRIKLWGGSRLKNNTQFIYA